MNFKLEQTPEGLTLVDLDDDRLNGLRVDFTSGALLHRLKHGLSKSQPLPKAIGILDGFVLDCTAGLGTDALIIAALGCRVRAIERSETVFALLADGKSRFDAVATGELASDANPIQDANATQDAKLSLIARRLTFEHGDARTILAGLATTAGAPAGAATSAGANAAATERPDVIYLDPMYPEEGHSKSALPKKPMQMFRKLLEGDQDAVELWTLAMAAKPKRVVVKRPLKAPPLGPKPAHSFEGKTARYDLYLPPQ